MSDASESLGLRTQFLYVVVLPEVSFLLLSLGTWITEG